MSNTKKTDLDDASHGGGIGDIPAQPIDPASPNSGETDPNFDSDGVDTHRDKDDSSYDRQRS